MIYSGKNSLLPPKSPFPSIHASYVDHIPSYGVGAKGLAKPREENSHHQRTSSESFLMEEQPSWFDELLDEPETPVRRGHRRSSSDSFAYNDTVNVGNTNYVAPDNNKLKNLTLLPSWGSQDYEFYRDVRHGSSYGGPNSSGKTKNRIWDMPVNSGAPPHGLPSPGDNTIIQNAGSSSSTSREAERSPFLPTEDQDPGEHGPHDLKGSSEKDSFHAKHSTLEMDTKRAKQQFAQRSRVRKLQYIAELERNVQSLQAEGSEVSSELEFLKQQNLILNMENKTLKQRSESLAQEHLIKLFEHEVLEREVGRLRALYQQQKQPSSSHRRVKSNDLDQQFANLSLKHKEASGGRNQVSGQLHI